MTKENAHLYLPFVQALSEGKDIEVLNPCTHEWEVMEDPLFSQLSETYRIKPEKKIVPFTWDDRELFRGKWVVKKVDLSIGKSKEYLITCITDNEVHFGASEYTYTEFMNYFTFLDGSPCGKEVEE